MNYLVGKLFESIDNNVEYETTNSKAVYKSVRLGGVSLELEEREEAFNETLAKGGHRDAGDHDVNSREEQVSRPDRRSLP